MTGLLAGRARRGVAVAAAAVLLAGACHDGKKPAAEPPSSSSSSSPSSSGSSGASGTATSTTVRPRRGGVFRIALVKPRSLDPAQARSPAEVLLADILFDSLTSYDAATGRVETSIAQRWSSTPDQQHWDFFLRPDARFANGRAITSTDVKYSLERVARKGSGVPELLVSQLEPIAGFRAFNVDGTAPGLAGVTTPFPSVVHIDLDRPLSALPSILGHPAFGIVPREGVESKKAAFADTPTGSGPFAVRSRTADVLSLQRGPGSSAFVDQIDVSLQADLGAAYQAFKSGRVDWTLVPPEQVEEASERYGRSGFAPYVGVLFYGFNLRNPKFSDVRFREAIVHAIDRQAISDVVYSGTVKRIDGPVAEGVTGFQENPCGPKCTHDPARSKTLLAAAFPNGQIPRIAIDYDQDKTQEAIATVMKANLAAVGIPCDLRPHSFSEYTQVIDKGQQELFRLGWIGSYPAADNFLTPLFVTGSDANVTGFSVSAVDLVLNAARAEVDPAKQIARYQDAERRIMDFVPIIPLAQFQSEAVVNRRVRGLELNALGTFDAASVWLATGD